MPTCLIDGSAHESVKDLHKYLRFLHVTQEAYYHEYVPRRDRLTNEMIPFKDVEQYVTAEFISKPNLKKWLKDNPDEGWKWSREWLKRRKDEKGLVYAPCQAELRTLMCPSMPYYEVHAEGEYYRLTDELGFKPRFITAQPVFTPLDSAIIQDTREQMPLKIDHPTQIETLNVGDYALSGARDVGIRIERKSLSDFCGTMSGRVVERKAGSDSAYQRFQRELDRATKAGYYVVMMVEANINDAQRFNYLPQTKRVKASPSYVFHQLRDILVQYPLSLQVLFVDGRVEMAKKMVRVLEMGAQVRSVDLQYAYERGIL